MYNNNTHIFFSWAAKIWMIFEGSYVSSTEYKKSNAHYFALAWVEQIIFAWMEQQL